MPFSRQQWEGWEISEKWEEKRMGRLDFFADFLGLQHDLLAGVAGSSRVGKKMRQGWGRVVTDRDFSISSRFWTAWRFWIFFLLLEEEEGNVQGSFWLLL
ncbi:hypothetical protein AABB24_036488, partial [Solanum stoloniferum]